jgi:hypothetical protein
MDGNEVAARLKFKGAKPECPVCDSTKWKDPQGPPFPLRVGNYDLEVFALVCNQCGFVRFHEAERLHD